jgi:methionine-gamma-lyase
MGKIHSNYGLSTLAAHLGEGENPHLAHVMPIYQTSTFDFENVQSGVEIMQRQKPGYFYTRSGNPNLAHFARKIAYLEGLDLIRSQPQNPEEDVVGGQVFASGMAAISSAVLSLVKAGDTIISQKDLYSGTYNLLVDIAPRYKINVVWLDNTSPEAWEDAFRKHPDAKIAYTETPVNPTMAVVDLKAVAGIAHRHQAWVLIDNTFATPYCQRPLTLGADVVLHSTTKYLSGHGLIIGGIVVTPHTEWLHGELRNFLSTLGGAESPFDAWLANNGLKTFEIRMQRHCENAMQIARYLEGHPKVSKVLYPGLESHQDHELARSQMLEFGAMMSFELKGGFDAGVKMMEQVQLCSLAVSLGDVDSRVSHPASMSHSNVPQEERLKIGISDGLVRFSIGIENAEDIIADLEQAMQD